MKLQISRALISLRSTPKAGGEIILAPDENRLVNGDSTLAEGLAVIAAKFIQSWKQL